MVEVQTVQPSTVLVEAGGGEPQPFWLTYPKPQGVEGKGPKASTKTVEAPSTTAVDQRNLSYYLQLVSLVTFHAGWLIFRFVGAVPRSGRAWICKHSPAVATSRLPPTGTSALRLLLPPSLTLGCHVSNTRRLPNPVPIPLALKPKPHPDTRASRKPGTVLATGDSKTVVREPFREPFRKPFGKVSP